MIDNTLSLFQDELEPVLEHSTSIVVALFDQDRKLLYKNNGFTHIVFESMLNEEPSYVLINPSFKKLLDMPDEGEIFHGVMTLGDGLHYHVSLKAKVIRKKEKLLICGEYDVQELMQTCSSVTDLNQRVNNLNRELQLSQIKLKQNVEELSRKTELLESSNSDLEQFAHIAAHDLKSPLNTIHGYAEMLNQMEDIDDKKQKLYVKRIVESSEVMSSMIYSLLKNSEISSGDIAMNRVDLNLVVARVVDELDLQIKEKQASIKVQKLPLINGDQTQMFQLFLNLITNALKYSRRDITPSIEISSRKINGKVDIFIRDNGIGIHTADQEKIFTLFTRLKTDDTVEGTGIGLATCKKIVNRHGGKLSVESTYGKGSTFVVSFSV